MRSVTAAVALLFIIITWPSSAFWHGSSQSQFNGGKSQLNFNFLGFGGEYPFLNLFKTGSLWLSASTNLAVAPNLLDANGYAAAGVNSPNMYQNIIVPPPPERAGNYVVAWDGNGTIIASTGTAVTYSISSISLAAQAVVTLSTTPNLKVNQTIAISGVTGTGWGGIGVNTSWPILAVAGNTVTIGFDSHALSGPTLSGSSLVSNSKTNTSATAGGRYVFSGVSVSNNQYSVNVGITSNGTVPITNLRLLYDADEANYNVGQIWQPVFLQWLRNAKIGVLRYLNWQGNGGVNFSNQSTWATRKPVAYACYACPQMDPARWVSSMTTAANGQDHTGTLVGITPSDRDTAHIQVPGASVSSIVTQAYTISAISSATQAVLTVSSTINLVANQNIIIAGVSGTGWSGINATMSIVSVNSGAGTITVGFDSHLLSAPTLSGASLIGFALVTTASPHGLTSGTTTYNLNINGSTNGYNNSNTILTVTGASTLTYAISAGTASPATGTPVYTVINTGAVTLNSTISADLLVTCASACGVNNGDPIQLVGTSGGGTLPDAQSGGHISGGSTLYVTGAGTNSFNVSFTSGGSNIKIGTAGTGTFSFTRMPTLALNGGSAIGICGSAGGAIDTSHNLRNIAIATVVYDVTFGCWMKGGAAVNNSSQGLDNGVPIELLVDLANQVGAHPYFVTPPYAADPITDWSSSVATYVKNNGPSWMIPRMEGPNEEWNATFPVASLAAGRGELYGWGHFQQNDWYGLVLSNAGQAWAAVYGIGNLGTKYHVLGGFQSSTSASGISGNAPRLTSAKYVAGSPTPPAGYTASRACNYASGVVMAEYQTPLGYRTTSSVANSFNYFLSGNTDLTQLAAYNDTLLNQSYGNAFGSLADLSVSWYPNARAWQQTYGSGGTACGGSAGTVNYLMGYEGGFSYTGPVNTPTAVVQSTVNVNTAVLSTVAGNPTQITLGTTVIPYTGSNTMTNGCTLTGKIDNGSGGAGNTLTVTASACGSSGNANSIIAGDVITGGTTAANTQVTAAGTGVGGTGTYTVNGAAQLVASAALTARLPPPLVANMYVCFSGLTGSWATFNFATSNTCYQISTVNDAINGVATIALDSSAASGSSTGTVYYSGDSLGGLVAGKTGSGIYATFLNTAVGVKSHSDMQGYTSGGSYAGGLQGNLDNFAAAGGTFPSQFQFGGSQNIWSAIDPDVFISQSPAPPIWQGISHFNQ